MLGDDESGMPERVRVRRELLLPASVMLCSEAMNERRQGETDDVGVVTNTRTERKLKTPKLYKVLLLNDDYTTMEFVVYVLQSIFRLPESEAVQIMLHVHKNGLGVAGVYPREIAETRIAQVEALARDYEYPLRCSMEEA
jgi:ATP-dependent Clp protease adaptor protein ClpS